MTAPAGVHKLQRYRLVGRAEREQQATLHDPLTGRYALVALVRGADPALFYSLDPLGRLCAYPLNDTNARRLVWLAPADFSALTPQPD